MQCFHPAQRLCFINMSSITLHSLPPQYLRSAWSCTINIQYTDGVFILSLSMFERKKKKIGKKKKSYLQGKEKCTDVNKSPANSTVTVRDRKCPSVRLSPPPEHRPRPVRAKRCVSSTLDSLTRQQTQRKTNNDINNYYYNKNNITDTESSGLHFTEVKKKFSLFKKSVSSV